MRINFLLFLIFQIIIVRSYVLKYVFKLEGDLSSIGHLDFDSNGNIYATAWYYDDNFEPHSTFYKLNPDKEILSAIPFTSNVSYISSMRVTTKGDAYFSLHYTDEPSDTLTVIRSGSETVEVIEGIGNNFLFLDSNDNLYYEKETGVYILRPGAIDAVKIKNLDDFEVTYPESTFNIDGNIYLMVTNKNDISDISIAVISKDELGNDVPEPKFLNFKIGREFVYGWAVDGKNNVWTATGTPELDGYLKRVTDGGYEIVNIDKNHPLLDLTAAEDGIWVIASNAFSSQPYSPSIYFVTSDSGILVIPELQNLTETSNFLAQSAIDQDGRAYFLDYQAEFTPELGSVIVINPGETKPVPIQVNLISDAAAIEISAIDINGNVWILAATSDWDYSYFVVQKGETTANLIPNFSDLCNDVKSNPVSREIFLSCGGGLVVAVDENK